MAGSRPSSTHPMRLGRSATTNQAATARNTRNNRSSLSAQKRHAARNAAGAHAMPPSGRQKGGVPSQASLTPFSPGPAAATPLESGKQRAEKGAPKRRAVANPSAAARWLAGDRINVPIPGSDPIPVTRRQFLAGAAGAAALIAAGVGASTVASKLKPAEEEGLNLLEVPEDAVTTADELTLIEDPSLYLTLVGDFDLPYGTLLWSNDDNIAACLVPGESAKPLTTIALLSLSSGNLNYVLKQAVNLDSGFEIYDVRAASEGMIWVEANIMSGIWRVYTATLDENLALGEPALADEGTGDWNMPSIALSAGRAFYQKLPNVDGPFATEDSVLMSVELGSSEPNIVYSSHGRMSTPPYSLDDSLVITPRTDTSSVHHQLTLLKAKDGSVMDTLTLPTSMKPLEAGFGKNGFFFSFDAIYNYGDGIANLGTYTPLQASSSAAYSDRPWFSFARTPTAAAAWCGNCFMVKSTRAVCGFCLDAGEYFSFDLESGTDSYGEYLASSGIRNKLITFANVDFKPIDGEPIHRCHVRVWSPVAPLEEPAEEESPEEPTE